MSTRLAAPDAAPGPEAVHPVHDQVALNRRRSLLLIASFAAGWFLLALLVLELIGGALLGLAGISFLLAVVFAAVLTYLAVGRAEARILGAIGARPADRTEHARLFNIVDGLCVANGLPEPAVYVVTSPAVNALATRRNPRTASVVVTTGLLESLDRMPLEAVVAHQLGRIKTDAAGVGTLVAGLVDGPLLRAIPGTQAGVIRRIIGSGSEARADLDAVGITRYPPGLLAALETCADRGSAVASATRPSAHLWFASPLVTEPASDPDAARNRVFDLFVPLSQRVDVAREL